MSITQEDLPAIESDYVPSAQQVADYRRDGHVLLRSVCSRSEISIYRRVLVDAATRLNAERRPLAARDTYGKAFLQTTNLWEQDALSRRFVFARRFARIAA